MQTIAVRTEPAGGGQSAQLASGCLARDAAGSRHAERVEADRGAAPAADQPWVSVTLDPDGESALINASIDIPAPAQKVAVTVMA